MPRHNRSTRPFVACASLLAASLASASPARADDVFRTNDPFGGFFGILGFDVFQFQSVAARFIPAQSYTFDSAGIWFMSNDDTGQTPQRVTVTLRTDVNPGTEFDSVPSDTILETWDVVLPVVGWNPELITFTSTVHPTLQAGQKYWLVAESHLGPLINPVWNWSSSGNEFTATTDGPSTPWEGGFGAAIAVIITGTPAGGGCPADFNGTGGATVQDIFDFLSDWNSQVAGGPVIIRSADFNNAGGITVQDIFDFLSAWNQGCP